MLLRYFFITFRNLRRQKMFSFVNIAGLAVSMMVCLMVLMSTKKDLSYDKFHPATARTWRITSKVQLPDGRKYHMASVPLALGEALRTDYSIIEKQVNIYGVLSGDVMIGKKKLGIQAAFTEPSFFDVFGFKLAAGNPVTALKEPNSIILSAVAAERFFGHSDPMGKVIHTDKFGDYIVTGVMAPPPGLSHIAYDAYASMSTVPALEQSKALPERLHDWNVFQDDYTYVVLQPGVKGTTLAHALAGLSQHYEQGPKENRTAIVFTPQALSKITPSRELYNDIDVGPPWAKILAGLGVAFAILLCACFNYTNLSIVRSLQRAREVGVRKVNGALRWQVFMQFIIESVVMCLLSLVLAIGLLILFREYTAFGREIIPNGRIDLGLLSWFLVFSVATGVLAGIIPAWALSSFQPAKVLRNMVDIKLFGGLGLRKTLIVIQFTLSLTAVIFFVTVYRQFSFKAVVDMGFNRDNVLNVPLADVDYQLMKDRMMQIKGVEMITASSGTLGMPRHSSFCKVKTANNQDLELGYYAADEDFLKVMHLKLLAGSGFPMAAAKEKEQYIIVNEKAVNVMGIKTPADAIGKTIWLSDSVQVNITGVVKDFNYQPIEVPVLPMAIRFIPKDFHQLQLLVDRGNDAQLIAEVKKSWEAMHPGEIFSSEWMYDQLYNRNSGGDTVSMLGFLVFMITLIAALGLLGMVSYTTFIRRKEIGIRKVMGAGVTNLVVLLSKNYLRLIIIAGAIALPLGYLGSSLFLRIFTQRVSIGAFTLIGGFAAMLSIAMLAIVSQTWRAANSNPVNTLRND
ncbi:ABC transporter permease [Chitinophaga sp. MM2321]|uniref:ABC transporter permease n=1 Tax=Chitinophaga sp. MM2321 TaxID=3137178 RepID=UPI0032D5A109